MSIGGRSPRNEQEIRDAVEHERIARSYMDKEYRLLGYDIYDRNGTKGWDLILSKNGNLYKTEEKFRDKDWGDFLIELFQCMITADPGWFYKTTANLISYVICDDEWIPQKIYLIDFDKFKGWLFQFLAENKTPLARTSPKGIGLSFNIAVDWIDIPPEICKISLTECRAPWIKAKNRNKQIRMELG